MEIIVSKYLRIVHPTDRIKQWCKKELVVANPEYAKKVRMGFWTGNTPSTLAFYEQDGNDLILPYGTLSMLPMDILINADFKSDFPVSKDVDYHAQVNLYDYQKQAVQAVYNAKFGILQSAAGSGKTQMGIALAVKFGKRCLWLCHTKDLIRQSKERAERYIDKSLLGTITEGKINIGTGITFATIQTMARLDQQKYQDVWDVVIVDECHRVCGSPTAVTQYEKVLNALNARHKYGLSATVHRSDGLIKATYCLLGKICYRVSDEAVADKIMKVGIFSVETGTKVSRECLNTDGTLNYTSLVTYLTKNKERNTLIAENLMSTACNHSVLILSDRLEHLATLIDLLPDYIRKDAVMISGKMVSKKGKAEREAALEDMRTGRKHYLFATYSLAKEGLDIPCLDRLFLTTPQKDYAVVTQAVGRIDRKCAGKADAFVYDFVDDIGYCVRAYKKRQAIYRKNNCYFTGDEI